MSDRLEIEEQRRFNLQQLQDRKLCIICAKSDEANIVKDQLGAMTKIEGHLVDRITQARGEPGHDFYLGALSSENDDIPYYITSTTRQGIQSFGVQTAALFTILKPRYAVHVGVCAAIAKEHIRLEDVIFGERALNYEEGKYEVTEDDVPRFLADGMHYHTKSDSMKGFVTEQRRDYWKHGDYISGCAVRMDAQATLGRVQNAGLRDVKALDMEASAFLQACDYTNVLALGIVKGVSDMGDRHKGIGHNRHHGPALRRAAIATKDFLSWKLNFMPRETRNLDRQPGAERTAGYFKNFVAPVVKKTLELKMDIPVDKETKKMEGFRIVMPPGSNVLAYNNLENIINGNELTETSLSGGVRASSLYVKGPFLFDFPTTLTELATIKNINPVEQVDHFAKTLGDRLEELNDRGFTSVISWKQFEELCHTVDSPATSTLLGTRK